MTEKNLLITSMQKLISHISKSKKNQEEIFNSLNKNDFKKILTNLDDEHITLRKTSLKLLGELLWANTPLKRTFCNIMEINLLPGNIVLNHKALQKINSYMILKEFTSLLKNANKKGQSDCLLWFIRINKSYNNQPLKIQYLSKSDLEKPQSNILDPLNCIIGIVLSQVDCSPYKTTTSEQFNKNKQIHQAQTKSSLIGMIESGYPLKTQVKDEVVSVSSGVGYQKYSKINRSTQLENQQKPKKFLNNYFQNHRINETAKINQLNQSATINKNMNNSIEFRPQRNSLANQQNPKIPSLNFQKKPSNNITINTDRYAQEFVSSNNRSIKDYDFQRLKYQQGIKVTSNNNTSKNVATKPVKQLFQNSFKYIKPMTSTTAEGKFIAFTNKNERGHETLRQKQTIDVFQYIKNR